MMRQTVWCAGLLAACTVVGLGVAGPAGAFAAVVTALVLAAAQAVRPAPAVQLVPVRVRRQTRRLPYDQG
jgi:hypothetical protein